MAWSRCFGQMGLLLLNFWCVSFLTRSSSLTNLSFAKLATCVAVVVAVCLSVSAALSTLWWFLARRIAWKDAHKLFFYLGFTFLNLIYFRNYCLTFGLLDIKYSRPVMMLLAAGLLAAYPLRFRSELGWLTESPDSIWRKTSAIFGGVGALAYLWIWALPLAPVSRRSTTTKPDVLLITCDALTSRHMSLYGYSRPTTPNLDSLAQQSYVFNNFKANFTDTSYGLVTLKGTLFDRQNRRPEGQADLMQRLESLGYRERVFVSFTPLHANFRKGFTETVTVRASYSLPLVRWLRRRNGDHSVIWLAQILAAPASFVNPFSSENPADITATQLGFSPELPLLVGLQTLSQAKEPTFVWVHLFQPHFPYSDGPFGNEPVDRYDNAIKLADRGIGNLLRDMKSTGLWDQTLLVISSDHGEAFSVKVDDTHEVSTHGGNWMADSVSAIPLLIRLPGQKEGKRVQTVAQQLDLAPTLMELLDGDSKGFVGESLKPYMDQPGRQSSSLKFTAPASRAERMNWKLSTLPFNWTAPDKETHAAYLGPFTILWDQYYQEQQGGWYKDVKGYENYRITSQGAAPPPVSEFIELMKKDASLRSVRE